MSFEKRDFRGVFESMATDLRRRAPALTDWEEGSVVRSLFESFAVEMALLYEQMDLVYRAGFVDTATGAHLDRVVAVLGITRNEPDFAAGEVAFERDPGSGDEVLIPVGTLVTTEEDPEKRPPRKAYVTVEEGRIPGGETSVDVKVQAEERGPEWISDSETVVVMPRPVPGVKTVRNRRPIRFQGRERETDEELRERAKKALLASGRASPTAIENALLGQPGVRGVRIREVFRDEAAASATDAPGGGDRSRAGLVEVYVDGLNSDNADRLRARVDEVRAAGIFVLMQPAVPIRVRATLRIETDPRLTPPDREKVERQVRDAVILFVDRLRMGQPLLFAQLTREVLNVKGVQDLADFRIVTVREAGDSAARGRVTLRRAAGPDRPVAVQASTETLRTAGGMRFAIVRQVAEDETDVDPETTSDVQLDTGEAGAAAEVRALVTGREGELLRTGGSVAWQPIQVGDVRLEVENAEPIRLPRRHFRPAEHTRVDASLEERFLPDLVRVASQAEPLPLRVQVLVRLELPGEAARATLFAALLAAAATARGTLAPPAGLPDAATRQVNRLLDTFFAGVRDAAAPLRDALAAEPAGALPATLAAAVQRQMDEAVAADGRIEEAAVQGAVDGVLRDELRAGDTAATVTAALAAGWRATVAGEVARFPLDAVERAIRGGLETAADAAAEAQAATVRTAAAALGDATSQLSLKSAQLAREIQASAGLTGTALTDAQKRIADLQAAVTAGEAAAESRRRELAAAQAEYDRRQASAAAERAAAPERARAAAEALRDAATQALGAVDAGTLVEATGVFPAEGPPPFTATVRLRAITADGEVHADAPLVEPEFVERPVAEPFVYTRPVELAGTLQLTLPLTATDAERRDVRAQVRQAVTDYLESLRPEENVELDRVRSLADRHDRVLRASFEPDEALADRVTRGTLAVGAFERVFVGDGFRVQA